LHLRASYSEGFRAPNIGELFNTGSRFDSTITDPCDANALAVTPENQANCIILGVPVGFQQLNPQISVTTGGNTTLTPEESETITIGLTWDTVGVSNSVGFIADSSFEFNYYDITVDNAIQAPNAGDVLTQCVQTLLPVFCDNVTRVGATVTRIDVMLQNIAGIETTGFDWTLNIGFEPTGIGEFRLRWVNTHLIDYIEIFDGPTGEIRVDRAGTELGSPERGFVEWKSSLIIDWLLNDWSVVFTNRYISEITEQCTGLVSDFGFSDLCTTPTTNNIDAEIYTDLQVSWSPSTRNDRWILTAGVQNMFDVETPICFSCDLNSFDGTLYPISGRYFYARLAFGL